MVVSYYYCFVRYTLSPFAILFECVLSVYGFVRYPFCPHCLLPDGCLVLTAIRPNVFGPILIFHILRTTINCRSLNFVADEVVGSTLTLQKSKLELTFYGAKINLKAKVWVFLFKKIIKYAPL